MHSNFLTDLKNEKLLYPLLDRYYQKLTKYTVKRIESKALQKEGVDVVLTNNKTNQKYYLDEKAQLDYINYSLPTFAFEIEYLLRQKSKKGWLFDTSKKTDFYGLATSIYTDENDTLISCSFLIVNRFKLITYLQELGLTYEQLLHYKAQHSSHGKIVLPELCSKKEGYLFYSKNNKAEKPVNLVLKLDWLKSISVAKSL